MSTTKPQNMSSELLLEVGEPTSLYESFDRSSIDQKKTFLYTLRVKRCMTLYSLTASCGNQLIA